MCIACLNKHLASVEEYQKEVEEIILNINCECCRTYPEFLKHNLQGLKLICLTKIKKNTLRCPKSIHTLIHMETHMKQEIKKNLAGLMDTLTEATTDTEKPLCEGSYLNKANQLKSLYDFIEMLDEADHR